MFRKLGFACLLLLAALSLPENSPLLSAIIPGFSLSDMAKNADLIAIGRIQITSERAQEITIQDRPSPSTEYFANLVIDNVLKSQDPQSTTIIRLHWFIPQANGPMYPDVKDGSYLLFFLKQRLGEQVYEFQSPFYPGLSVVPGTPIKSGDLEDQIIDQVCAFLESAVSGTQEKLRMIIELHGVNNPQFSRTLHQLLAGPDARLQMAALAALLQRREAALIPKAEDEILLSSSAAKLIERQNLILALSANFDASRSLAILSKALEAPEPEIRATSAYALRLTRSADAVRPLLSAMDDLDSEVQWNAMHSLGELVNHLDWRPRSKEPAEWQRCLDLWHEFSLTWAPPK